MLIVNCSKRKQLPLIEKIERFKVSKCQNGCGIDSIGVRKNEIENGNLNVRLRVHSKLFLERSLFEKCY